MPGFLSEYAGTVVVDARTGKVVEGERPQWWVELLKSLTQADADHVEARMADGMAVERTVERQTGPGDESGRMTIAGAALLAQGEETLVRSIVDWNLSDEDGEVIPVGKANPEMPTTLREQQFALTRASLKRLPASVVTALQKAAIDLNQPRSAEDAATFPARSAGGNGGGDGGGATGAV